MSLEIGFIETGNIGNPMAAQILAAYASFRSTSPLLNQVLVAILDPMRAGDVFGEDAGAQPKVAVIGERNRLVFGIEGQK